MEKAVLFPKTRLNKRESDALREMKVTYDVFSYASGSVLFEMGRTKVLCAVTLQNGVPHFLRGKRRGWLTAEYSLLPASTPVRTVREVTANKRNGRTIEISRLIGRALRAVTNLHVLGEQTIFIDCDVLQADGGTRTACIIGAYLALKAAESVWIERGIIPYSFLTDEIAAISVGLGNQGVLLDMDFSEDNMTDADFNFVLTRSERIIEIQGSGEKGPLSWKDYDAMKEIAVKGSQDLFEFYDMNSYELPYSDKKTQQSRPLFSMDSSVN